MALTDAEVQEIKFRLGYTAMAITARPYLAVVAAFEEVVKNNVNDFGETRIRDKVLPRLNQLEDEIYNARGRFGIKEIVGEVVFETGGGTINLRERQLGQQYNRWLTDLSSLVGIPIAPAPVFQGNDGYSIVVS